MEPPAATSQRFVELDSFKPGSPASAPDANQQRQEMAAQLAKASNSPWTADQYPLIARWLAVNDHPLNQVVAAGMLPRFYVPLIYPSGSPVTTDAKPPRLEVLRAAAQALRARAMLKLGGGDLSSAATDVRAMHRLARLVGQGNLLSERMTAGGIEAMACEADCLMAGSKKLSRETCRLELMAISSLSPLPPLWECVDKADRFGALDITHICAHGNTARFAKTYLGLELPEGQEVQMDWNVILRMQNFWFDREVALLRLADPAKRRKAADEFAADLEVLKRWRQSEGEARLRELAAKDTRNSSELRTEKSELFGKMLVTAFLTSPLPLVEFQNDKATILDLDRVVLALELIKADKGHYPEKLEALTPDYLATIPKDRFSDGSLIYRLEPKGYVLYSVGPNMKDDGGRTKGDGGDPPGDDIVVRMD
jgi:hypothetical protein